jgi:hypothetical protein
VAARNHQVHRGLRAVIANLAAAARGSGDLELSGTPWPAGPDDGRGYAGGRRRTTPMPERLPRNLSPQAKKHLLTSDAVVRVTAEVGPAADQVLVRAEVTRLGGVVESWSGESRLLVVDIEAGQLGRLAGLSGVVYVETAQPYSH